MDFLSNSLDWFPIFLSIRVAGAALFAVIVIGVPLSFYMARHDFPGKDVLEAVLTLPLVLPPVVTGFLLLLLIGRQGPVGFFVDWAFDAQMVFTPLAAVLAASVVAFPLMYQSVKAAFQSVDSHLEDVARTLGASELKIFFTITIPLAWPGIVAGMILAYARALGEFGATIMIAGNIPGKTQTLPTAIYFASEANNLTLAGMYVLVISVITFGMMVGLNYWTRRRIQQRSEATHAES